MSCLHWTETPFDTRKPDLRFYADWWEKGKLPARIGRGFFVPVGQLNIVV